MSPNRLGEKGVCRNRLLLGLRDRQAVFSRVFLL